MSHIPIDTDTLAGLHVTLGGITVPDIMHGDNLAITLCTAYDNPDQDPDETGWTPDAIAGQEAVLVAIRDHYDPAIKCVIALRAQAAKDKARIERLQAALKCARALLRSGADLLSVESEALREGITVNGELRADPEDAPAVEVIEDIEAWIADVADFVNARAALEDGE
ncbi:hypothetical protein [EBPR podovirus 2]|nr:hypothetical protein [EBPR podovirus 2]